MIAFKRTLLIFLLLASLLFLGYQLQLIINPILANNPDRKYVHLVDQYHVLTMERLVLEEKYAVTQSKYKLIALYKGDRTVLAKLAVNSSEPRTASFLSDQVLAKINRHASTQEPIGLSLAEAKTFEQLEAYVSDAKPMQSPSLSNDEKFLLNCHSDEFTLQLMGVRDPNELTHYIKDNSLDSAHILHTYYLNKDWYVLVYGLYKNHTEALKAIDVLPSDIKNQKPWIRQLASVQKAIQLYRK